MSHQKLRVSSLMVCSAAMCTARSPVCKEKLNVITSVVGRGGFICRPHRLVPHLHRLPVLPRKFSLARPLCCRTMQPQKSHLSAEIMKKLRMRSIYSKSRAYYSALKSLSATLAGKERHGRWLYWSKPRFFQHCSAQLYAVKPSMNGRSRSVLCTFV